MCFASLAGSEVIVGAPMELFVFAQCVGGVHTRVGVSNQASLFSLPTAFKPSLSRTRKGCLGRYSAKYHCLWPARVALAALGLQALYGRRLLRRSRGTTRKPNPPQKCRHTSKNKLKAPPIRQLFPHPKERQPTPPHNREPQKEEERQRRR